jgi:hypothetical protein
MDKSYLVPFLAAAGVFATLSWIDMCHRIIKDPVITKQVFILPYWQRNNQLFKTIPSQVPGHQTREDNMEDNV